MILNAIKENKALPSLNSLEAPERELARLMHKFIVEDKEFNAKIEALEIAIKILYV